MAKTKAKKAASKSSAGSSALLIGTKKGGFILRGDRSRKSWKVNGPIMLGSGVHHMVLDPRDGKTLLMTGFTGHLGPSVFRSVDGGKTWKEAKQPPAFKKAKEGETGKVVKHNFWLTPGHASEPNVWYAGTSPQGLFRSEDGGVTWEGVASFNDDPGWDKWTGGAQDGTPDGPKMHSIIIDPRDKRHMYIGMSSGGIHETMDQGKTWSPLIKGMKHAFLPDEQADDAPSHDPHCVVLHPAKPDRLYMQAHTGIYKIDRPGDRWERIGLKMPKQVGDIGFPIVVHPRDPNTAWVFPMDGTAVWPRTSPDGKPAVFMTSDAGKSWKRMANGLPKANAWWTVFRQAMATDANSSVGVYFGTTTGDVWASVNEGKSWKCIAQNLPHIYAIEAATL